MRRKYNIKSMILSCLDIHKAFDYLIYIRIMDEIFYKAANKLKNDKT